MSRFPRTLTVLAPVLDVAAEQHTTLRARTADCGSTDRVLSYDGHVTEIKSSVNLVLQAILSE